MWLFDQTGLCKQELITGSKLRAAIEATRGLSLRDRRYLLQLVNSHSDHLSAVNPKARIRWGKRWFARNCRTIFTWGDINRSPITQCFWSLSVTAGVAHRTSKRISTFRGSFGPCVGECGDCPTWGCLNQRITSTCAMEHMCKASAWYLGICI